MHRIKLLCWLGLVILSGCAKSYAPDEWLDPATEAQRTAHGGWIVVTTAHTQLVQGELLAIDRDTVIVLNDFGVREIPIDSVVRLRLERYETNAQNLGTITTLGTLSTLSHGVGLIISAPVWLVFGSICTSAQSSAGLFATKEPREHRDQLRAYARFPQGMPPGLDRQTLQPKPSLRK